MDVASGIGKVLRQPSQLLLVGVMLLEATITTGAITLSRQTRAGVHQLKDREKTHVLAMAVAGMVDTASRMTKIP
jgi:hypothetical protein